MTEIIPRAAGDKSKGFNTQVLRAISLVLDKLISGQDQVYCALEVLEDVLLIDSDSGKAYKTTLEEDKNYTSKFSFRSESVRNTLVSFFDQYYKFYKDPSLSLCFYAQTSIANESFDKAYVNSTNGLEEEHRGKRSILRKLNDGESLDEVELYIAYCVFKKEYLAQYKDREDGRKGYSHIVEVLAVDDFKDFLMRISWNISDESNGDLETEIFEKIRSVDFFDYKCQGKEEFILSRLYYEFEKRKTNSGFISKLVNKSDVVLIFMRSISEYSQQDMSWRLWESIETDDLRDLRDKILSVCPEYRPKSIQGLYRKVGIASSEEASHGRDYISQKVRVLSVCESILDKFIDDYDGESISKKEVRDIFEDLEKKSIVAIEGLKKDYSYSVSNDELVKGIVYSLFNECYLAFDDYEYE